jgi:hypothetical protein
MNEIGNQEQYVPNDSRPSAPNDRIPRCAFASRAAFEQLAEFLDAREAQHRRKRRDDADAEFGRKAKSAIKKGIGYSVCALVIFALGSTHPQVRAALLWIFEHGPWTWGA